MAIICILSYSGIARSKILVGLDQTHNNKPMHFIYCPGRILYYTTIIYSKENGIAIADTKRISLELKKGFSRWDAELKALKKLRASPFFKTTNNVYIIPNNLTVTTLVRTSFLNNKVFSSIQNFKKGEYKIVGVFYAKPKQLYAEIISNKNFEALNASLEKLNFPKMSCASRKAGIYNGSIVVNPDFKKTIVILDMNEFNTNCLFINESKTVLISLPFSRVKLIEKVKKHYKTYYASAAEKLNKSGFIGLGPDYEEPKNKDSLIISKIMRKDFLKMTTKFKKQRARIAQYMGTELSNKIYITGSNSVSAFTTRVLAEETKMKVEYLNPFQVIKLSKNLNKKILARNAHEYTPIIGTAVELVTETPTRMALEK